MSPVLALHLPHTRHVIHNNKLSERTNTEQPVLQRKPLDMG